jgi:hypothetical protein
MDKVASDSEWYAPSAEPFRFSLFYHRISCDTEINGEQRIIWYMDNRYGTITR